MSVDQIDQLSTAERIRLSALRYVTGDEAGQYIAIMRVLTGAVAQLAADFSAAEVREALTDRGLLLELDTVEARLSYLVEHGNLARSPREATARSLQEYLATRSRYQLTQRGELVHRHVEELLESTEGAREASAEMLPAIEESLRSLIDLGAPGRLSAADPQEIAQRIVTLFVQFGELVTSTRAFYTYLRETTSRYDLDLAQVTAYRDVLIAYLQEFVDDVGRYELVIGEALDQIRPLVPDLLGRASEGIRLVDDAGRRARRATGLQAEDWERLYGWFTSRPGRGSDATEVRLGATRVIRGLLVNLRRHVDVGRETGRYGDLLRLAGWFAGADDATAHRLWTAAFGLYPSRHLGFLVGGEAAGGEDVPPTTSWWSAPAAEVPVTLRANGDRTVRGRPPARQDFSLAKAQLRRERDEADRRRRVALAELADLARARADLDPDDPRRAAMWIANDDTRELLLALVSTAIAEGDPARPSARLHDPPLTLTLRRAPDAGTSIDGPGGSLEIVGMSLDLVPGATRSLAVDELERQAV